MKMRSLFAIFLLVYLAHAAGERDDVTVIMTAGQRHQVVEFAPGRYYVEEVGTAEAEDEDESAEMAATRIRRQWGSERDEVVVGSVDLSGVDAQLERYFRRHSRDDATSGRRRKRQTTMGETEATGEHEMLIIGEEGAFRRETAGAGSNPSSAGTFLFQSKLHHVLVFRPEKCRVPLVGAVEVSTSPRRGGGVPVDPVPAAPSR